MEYRLIFRSPILAIERMQPFIRTLGDVLSFRGEETQDPTEVVITGGPPHKIGGPRGAHGRGRNCKDQRLASFQNGISSAVRIERAAKNFIAKTVRAAS